MSDSLVCTENQHPIFCTEINQNTPVPSATTVVAVAAEDVASSVTATRSRMAEAPTELRKAVFLVEVDIFASHKVLAGNIEIV